MAALLHANSIDFFNRGRNTLCRTNTQQVRDTQFSDWIRRGPRTPHE